MTKTDYIRFRCSVELKRMAEQQAIERGMNITEYMEYLVRKDANNMMYIYNTECMNSNVKEKIISNGLAVALNDSFLLAKVSELIVDGAIIKSDLSFDEYIEMFNDGGFVTLIDDLQITKNYVLDLMRDELYQSCGDGNQSYADRIYSSNDPYVEIEKIMNECLLTLLQIKIDEIQNNFQTITDQIKNGTFEWH